MRSTWPRGCRASRRPAESPSARKRGGWSKATSSCAALGRPKSRGIGEPIEVYEVVGVGALHGHFDLAARRGLTRFVGRESELAQMRRALELAMGGHGQIVAAMAEAGTGKSRLVYEFKATIRPTLQGARSVFGVARQGVGVAAGARIAARLLRYRGRR